MTPDYGKTFALWHEGAAGPWRDYTHHGFVEGMRDGTLPRASFIHYLIQDYVFLVHFARAWSLAWSLAVVKSETIGEMKVCAGTPYANWIATYADPGYQSVCTTVGAMIDDAVARRIGDLANSPRNSALQARFTKATELEVGFWQMGLRGL